MCALQAESAWPGKISPARPVGTVQKCHTGPTPRPESNPHGHASGTKPHPAAPSRNPQEPCDPRADASICLTAQPTPRNPKPTRRPQRRQCAQPPQPPRPTPRRPPPRATSQYKRAFSAARLFSFPALLLNLTTASASPEFCTGSSVVKCKVPACSVEVEHG